MTWDFDHLGRSLTVLFTSTAYIILIDRSRTSEGKFEFSVLTFMCLTALGKLVLSLLFLLRSPESRPSSWKPKLKSFAMYFVSGFVYSVNDVFVFIVMSQGFTASVYVVLQCAKVAVVAVLSRIILKRLLTQLQWLSLVLLSCGIVLSSYPMCQEDDRNKGVPLVGYLYVAIAEVVGGIAGVSNEYIMKRDSTRQIPLEEEGVAHVQDPPDGLHVQNLYLYSGMFLQALIGLLLFERPYLTQPGGPWVDFNAVVWSCIVVNCVRGISISMVYKYKTILLKIFIVSCSIFLTALIMHFFLDSPITMQHILSIITISIALYMYHIKPELQPTPGKKRQAVRRPASLGMHMLNQLKGRPAAANYTSVLSEQLEWSENGDDDVDVILEGLSSSEDEGLDALHAELSGIKVSESESKTTQSTIPTAKSPTSSAETRKTKFRAFLDDSDSDADFDGDL